MIFGISSWSRIGWILSSYLRLVPAVARDQEKMAESAELYDGLLTLELLDHFQRMTTKKRMSSEAMQQWLAGAALHLHLRIHQVRHLLKILLLLISIHCWLRVPHQARSVCRVRVADKMKAASPARSSTLMLTTTQQHLTV